MSVRLNASTVVFLTLVIASGCAQSAREQKSRQPAVPAGKVATESAPGAKLEITDLVTGTGAVAETGKTVTVHYRGTLADGTEFDSSRKHGKPFPFRLGAGKVIPGWDEGVKGMKVGGKRKLVVPPSMAYGEQGFGGVIPPNATLTFEVELLKVGLE
jgi:FKBP-type peptidyl-prolyl cis-trans isomerase